MQLTRLIHSVPSSVAFPQSPCRGKYNFSASLFDDIGERLPSLANHFYRETELNLWLVPCLHARLGKGWLGIVGGMQDLSVSNVRKQMANILTSTPSSLSSACGLCPNQQFRCVTSKANTPSTSKKITLCPSTRLRVTWTMTDRSCKNDSWMFDCCPSHERGKYADYSSCWQFLHGEIGLGQEPLAFGSDRTEDAWKLG